MINPGDWLVLFVVLGLVGGCCRAVLWGGAVARERVRWRRECRERGWTPEEAQAHWRVRRVLIDIRHERDE